MVGEERHDPLSLQCRNLCHREEETKTALKAGSATDRYGRGKGRVIVPDCVPAEAGNLEEELARWR